MITVSKANSIVFTPVDPSTGRYTALQSFDTRLGGNEFHSGWLTQKTSTYFLKGETVNCQFIVNAGNVVTISATGNAIASAPALINSFTTGVLSYEIFEYSVSFNTAECVQVTLRSPTDKLISESIEVIDLPAREASEMGWLKLQWFNFDNLPALDFTTAIVCHCWVRGNMLEWTPKIDSDIFSNNEETLRLRGLMSRQIRAVIGDLSRQSADKITHAAILDKFFINEVEYVLEEDVEPTPYANAVELGMTLTQRNVIGLNTHDLGISTEIIEVMNYVFNLQSQSFTTPVLPHGFILHMIYVEYVSGESVVVKGGNVNLGDSDILFELKFPNSDKVDSTNHMHVVKLVDGNVKFEISGSNPVVSIHLNLINGNA